MKVPPLHPVFLGLLIGLCCIRCTLDEGNPGSTEPALTLQVHPQLSLLTLEWPKVKVTGFKEYVLLQSTGDIPNAPTPTVNQDVTVLTRINDVNVTSFSTTNTLFSTNACYKLYCSVEDRFLYSGTVCINQPLIALSGFFDRVDHAAGFDEIAMFDRLNSQLVAYNDESGTISNSITEINLSFPTLDLSSFQNVKRLFSFDQSTQLRKYSFPELSLQNQKTFSETLIGGMAWNGFVFVTLQSSLSGFQILNANTLSVVDSKKGLSGNRNVAVFDGDTLTVLEIGDAAIQRYRVNSSGKVISSDQYTTGVNQISVQNTSDVSHDYYIGGRFSTLVNRDAEIVTSLVSGVNAFTQLCRFSPDGTKAVVIISDVNTVTLQLFDLSALPAFTQIKSYSLPIASFADLYIREDVIYVVGVSFNFSAPQTFFLKFPM